MHVNDRPCGLILMGDQNEAAKWVPWAKQQMISQQRISGATWQKVYRPNPDVLITLSALPTLSKIMIEAGATVFLESGAVDPGLFTEPSPGMIYTGGFLNSNTSWGKLNPVTLAPANAGQAPIVDGQNAGCMSYVPPDGIDPGVQAAQEEAFKAYKQMVATVPPSNFSGKMRLYIQALYGRKYRANNTRVPRLPIANVPELQVTTKSGRPINYANASSSSTGIYTDENWNYYLVDVQMLSTVTEITVTVTPLEPSSVGKRVRSALKSRIDSLSAAQIKRYEAVILSTCWPSDDITCVVGTGKTPVATSTLAYGWSFTSNGHEASVIVHGTQEFLQSGSPRYRRLATEYKLTLSRDSTKTFPADSPLTPSQQEQARWTAVVTTVSSEVPWQSEYNRQIIWTPIPLYQKLGKFQGAAFGQTPTTSDADIYCFYDASDTLHRVHLKNNIFTAGYSATRVNDPKFTTTDLWCGDMGVQTHGDITYSDQTASEFSITGTSAKVSETSVYVTDWTTDRYGTGDIVFIGNSSSWAGYTNPPGTSYLRIAYTRYAQDRKEFDALAYGVIALIIPFDDCAAAYITSTNTYGLITGGYGTDRGTSADGWFVKEVRPYNVDNEPLDSWTLTTAPTSKLGAGSSIWTYAPANYESKVFSLVPVTGTSIPLDPALLSSLVLTPVSAEFLPYKYSTTSSYVYTDVEYFGISSDDYPLTVRPKIFVGFA